MIQLNSQEQMRNGGCYEIDSLLKNPVVGCIAKDHIPLLMLVFWRRREFIPWGLSFGVVVTAIAGTGRRETYAGTAS